MVTVVCTHVAFVRFFRRSVEEVICTYQFFQLEEKTNNIRLIAIVKKVFLLRVSIFVWMSAIRRRSVMSFRAGATVHQKVLVEQMSGSCVGDSQKFLGFLFVRYRNFPTSQKKFAFTMPVISIKI